LNRRHDITVTLGIRPGHIDDRLGINPDPFSDLRLYYKAPLYLMKGELIDPGLDKHVKHA